MVKFFGEITFNLKPDEGNERKTRELKDNIDSVITKTDSVFPCPFLYRILVYCIFLETD